MKKFKGLSVLLAAVLVVNSIVFTKAKALAAEDTQINSRIIEVNFPQQEKAEDSNGYIPSAIKVEKSSGGNYYKSSYVPAQYDLRSSGYVTPIRNQGQIGSCWTFSAYGSLESVEKKKDGQTFDFSEINMATHNGIVDANSGGNNQIAAAYLVAWKGAVMESDDPYPYPAYPENIEVRNGIPAKYHVQDIIFLPSRTTSTDNLEIKNAIMNYGAVSTSYYSETSYYKNNGKTSYYFPEKHIGNHAITIIGWDDNFSPSNFTKEPPGPGAFLCRNSWGDYWGDNGYFYISYYDPNFGYDSNAVFNGVESANNYKNLYSYSDKMVNKGFANQQYSGNKYTAINDDIISAVGFYTFEQNVSYQVYVEKVVGGNIPNPNNLAASGSFSQAGYHTIKLNNKLKLYKGDQFMVWIKISGDYYYAYYDASSLTSGKSYYINNGLAIEYKGTFLINAYSESYDASQYISIASEEPANGELTIDEPISLTYSDNISAGSGFNNISLKDENNVEVNKSVTISGNKLIIKETPQNHLNGQLKLYIPKDAVKNTAGKYNYLDYNRTFNVYVADNTIVKVKDAVLEKLIRQKLSKANGDITAADMKKIESLNSWDLQTGGKISSLAGLEYAYNLKELTAEYNNIVSLQPLKNLRKLTLLDLTSNNIKDLSPLGQLVNLKELNVDRNYIRDVSPLRNLVNLSCLNIYRNQISDIGSLSNLTNLQSLDISYNLIKNISALENIVINSKGSDLSIYMEKNYINFSAGSAASKTLQVLNNNAVGYSGQDKQNTGLQLVTVNGKTSLYYINDMPAGQKLVLEFNEPIALASNASSLISLSNQYDESSYKINLKTAGNTLIITTLSEIPTDSYIALDIADGAVLNKNNNNIRTSSIHLDIFTSINRYGDFNKDNSVTILDLAQLSSQYNTTIDKAGTWDFAKDFNEDGVIDIYDLAILGNYIK